MLKQVFNALLQVSVKSFESLQFVGVKTHAGECTDLRTEENWYVIGF